MFKFLAKLFHGFVCWEIEKGRDKTHKFVECSVCGWVDATWSKWIQEGQTKAQLYKYLNHE